MSFPPCYKLILRAKKKKKILYFTVKVIGFYGWNLTFVSPVKLLALVYYDARSHTG